jgi:phosphoserine phosphatase RsbU/P
MQAADRMTSSTPKLTAEFTVHTPLLPPERYAFSGELVTIGRSSECSIPIKDRYLSRRHAEIFPAGEQWVLKDLGSANGTFVNGSRVAGIRPLISGDRIRVGDTEIAFHLEHSTDRLQVTSSGTVSPTMSIPLSEIEKTPEVSGKTLDRVRILNALAIDLIEEHSSDELFGFILDRVMEHLKPSRAAIGLLGSNSLSLVDIEIRRRDPQDDRELSISQTLLRDAVEQRRALAFVDVSLDEKLSRAQSIIAQGIRSVLCAPLLIGESVAGILYVDFLFAQRALSEEDLRLVAQIARFAAIKIENSRLRDVVIQKRLMDEELKTAYVVQQSLLPDAPPPIEGFSLAGCNRPSRMVSGDYYDFILRPDGRLYFVIADVSGKGVTAALLMAGLQASFRIFAKQDPPPGELIERLNDVLRETIPRSKFITLFCGRLDPSTGEIEYANAGHTPPLLLRSDSCQELPDGDILLGMMPSRYGTHRVTLAPGDALILFTDGLSEAEDDTGEEYSSSGVARTLLPLYGRRAGEVALALELAVSEYAGKDHLDDDLTLLVVARNS